MKKFRELSPVVNCLAPRVGLEPTTCGLTVRRSTDWAIGESGNTNYTGPHGGLQVFLWKIFKIISHYLINQRVIDEKIFENFFNLFFFAIPPQSEPRQCASLMRFPSIDRRILIQCGFVFGASRGETGYHDSLLSCLSGFESRRGDHKIVWRILPSSSPSFLCFPFGHFFYTSLVF